MIGVTVGVGGRMGAAIVWFLVVVDVAGGVGVVRAVSRPVTCLSTLVAVAFGSA